MKLTGNTILITGGGAGIGRGLAEALHKLGNQVIIAGRRKSALDETTAAHPGMKSIELDITNPENVTAVARELIGTYPALNVLINNAGIMHIDDLSAPVDDAMMVDTLTTNLMGPIRMTGALVEHLQKQNDAVIVNVSSVLGFVPLAIAGVYSSTKAAIHSYTQSLRYKLKDSSVRVVEIAPPWVQTDLLNSRNEPRAMPLAPFIEQTIEALGTDADEALVEIARPCATTRVRTKARSSRSSTTRSRRVKRADPACRSASRVGAGARMRLHARRHFCSDTCTSASIAIP